jgi:uncharacterized protein YcnI
MIPFSVISKKAVRALPAVLATLAVAAHAHVVLEYQVAPAGSSYKATFKVSHGCAGAPTREISVRIPDGVRGAHPMPKPGWDIAIQRQKLAAPYQSDGRTVSEDVVRITWTAKTREDMLPNAWYDEFVLVGQLAAGPGPMYWPVSQVCEQGRADWTEIPRPGQKASELKTPAPLLEVLPSAGGGGHQH